MAQMLLESTMSWYRSLNAHNGFANSQTLNDLRTSGSKIRISGREEGACGQSTIYRNTPRMRFYAMALPCRFAQFAPAISNLARHFDGLSSDSRYNRFFGFKNSLTSNELRYFTEPDFRRRVALSVENHDGGSSLTVSLAVGPALGRREQTAPYRPYRHDRDGHEESCR